MGPDPIPRTVERVESHLRPHSPTPSSKTTSGETSQAQALQNAFAARRTHRPGSTTRREIFITLLPSISTAQQTLAPCAPPSKLLPFQRPPPPPSASPRTPKPRTRPPSPVTAREPQTKRPGAHECPLSFGV